MTAQFITAKEAAHLIEDRWTVGIDAFIGFCLADDILGEIETRFVSEGHPADLSVLNVAGIGGDGKGRGINHFAHEGLMRRFLCSNLSLANRMYPLIMEDKVPTYMIPQGVLSHMMRALTSGKPGVISQVGMRTFVDPRVDGGKINHAAETIDPADAYNVELIDIRGEEFLFYPAVPLDACIIKGSFADEEGNISIEKEAIHIEQYEMAAATRNNGGRVFVQVDARVPKGSIHPQKVAVPANMVDYVIVGSPGNTGQHFIDDPRILGAQKGHPVASWSGDVRIPFDDISPMPFGLPKIICRRGLFEMEKGDFINLGIGISMDVSSVLNEEGRIDDISSSIESGVIGGVPAPGIATGAAYNPTAMLKQPDIFDFYDGGGIDFAALGAAEIDAQGNVNVSRFAGKVTGPGGFINISQGAKKVCFMGTFTAGKHDIRIEDGKLRILEDGPYIKFVKNVDHITFSGRYSQEKARKQQVFYITERAVFELRPEGLTLTEIAPGANLERDILGKMEFTPRIADHLKLMDERIFRPEKMEIRLKERGSHD
ncbi:MAG: 3-oxoacid CoA-transferase [Firmicutes bacterium]|nr:3-oxoacid CoA-transferase [Bacillota bacterium]